MRKLRLATFVLVIPLPLMGATCDGPMPSPNLVGVSKRCMVPPESIKKIAAGQSITDHDAENIKARKREASKTRCLQKWVRTATSN